jgi:hypothetical protein
MGNYELFSAFLAITIVMFAILLVLYLYAYQKVKHGSNIQDVKRITILMIISSLAGIVVFIDGFFIMHTPQEYHGYTPAYQEMIYEKVGVVSVSPVSLLTTILPFFRMNQVTTSLNLESSLPPRPSETRPSPPLIGFSLLSIT